MKKFLLSAVFVSLISMGFVSCVTAQSPATKVSSKVQTLATVTENVLALTGTATGNETVDKFLVSTSGLLQKYKSINTALNAYNVIKNGTTSSITNNGEKLSKLAALGQLTGISKQLTSLGSEASTTAVSGAELLKSLSGNTNRETVSKVETAVNALSLLGMEIPKSVTTTTTLLSALKGK